MNKSAIKNFAVNARRKLIEGVEQKAYELGITRTEIKEPVTYEDGFHINQKYYKKYEIKQREKLLSRMKDNGFEQVIEEVAYTWFNRFIAIRFMEVNEYLPTGIRMFSSIIEGKTEPDAVTEVDMIAGDLELDLDKVYQMQDDGDTEDLFKYILVKQCNKLGEIMPRMFEVIQDYSELLLPDGLLSDGSVIRDMISMINEQDWTEQVEIIGWLYQYYISEKKDQVFADLKKNKKITKENIPAATQLFTPKWIVQYMVENSLGRLWFESHPDEKLQGKWKYFLEGADQEPDVEKELDKLINPHLNPEEITVLDPCMGSGHILVYAFDVLYDIYLSAGYAEREIPKLILEKNIYGLDIDDRAAQLAYFALLMKGCSYYRGILDQCIELNVRSIQQSNSITKKMLHNLLEHSVVEEKEALFQAIEYIFEVFYDAKEYGSILHVEPIDINMLENWIEYLSTVEFNDLFMEHDKSNILQEFPQLIQQAEMMSRKYDVVVTNPPYMGSSGMGGKLNNYVRKYYPLSKSDLFAAFMEMGTLSTKKSGFISFINQHSWMFLSSYEKLRNKLLDNNIIICMAHLGARSFEDIGGEIVQTTTFILKNVYISNVKGVYINLVDNKTALEKKEQGLIAIHNPNVSYRYSFNQDDFSKIPGRPIAYRLSENIINSFSNNQLIGEKIAFKKGMSTGDNERFIKKWFEVCKDNLGLNFFSNEDAKNSKLKWFPINSGGEYRKWYGNNLHVVNWFNDGLEMKANAVILNNGGHWSRYIVNEKYFFNKGITWTAISSSNFGVRRFEEGFLFSSASMSGFGDNADLDLISGLLNSKVATPYLRVLSPTLNFGPEQVKKIPLIVDENNRKKIELIVTLNVTISKNDWDNFEISWDFEKQPLIKFKENTSNIYSSYKNWESYTTEQFIQVQKNEEELNRIFIEIYDLQDELTPEVEDKEVTVRKADLTRDIKSFLSYAIGCMFGRYSLDHEGLVYAGGEFDLSKYSTFSVDADNVIPVTDDEYFEDDLVSRLVEFVRVTFGEESLEENLDFIADALKRKGNETARQRIRRYFLKEFYKDHVQLYQKRPIYWMFDSGKNDGFKALIYLHRYETGLVARVRTDYLHMLQKKYEAEMGQCDLIMESDVSVAEKTRAKKQKEKLQKQLLECQQYDQVIAHVANQTIELDLDDGVKVNYAKFQGVEIPQGEGKKPLIADVLAKI